MCHSFFIWFLSWSLYLPIEWLLSVRLRSFFFAMLTIGQVLYISRSNTVSLGLRHPLHLLRHDRCTVLFSSQLRFLLNLIILVWLSSCMWYLSCRLSNNKVIGKFITIFEDWTACITWWMVQGKATIPPLQPLILSQSYCSCDFMPFSIVQKNFWSSWWHYFPQRSVSWYGY